MPSPLDRLLDASDIGCWSWLDGAVRWNETMLRLFERAEAPADYPAYLEALHPDDRARMDANIQRFMAEGRYEDIEHRILLPDGSERWVFCRGRAVLGEDGGVRGLEGIVMDITAQKAREEVLAKEARTDPLTGLRNRRWLQDEAPREVAECERGREPFALTLIDLDGFKAVNDGPGGHQLGDRVLQELAGRLQGAIRAGDALVRLGGDELLAVFPQTGTEDAKRVAARLLHAVAGGPLAGVSMSASGGLAAWRPGDDIDAVVRRADKALYEAKRSGGGRLAVAPAAPDAAEREEQAG